jgi:hypothetical protein
MTANTAADDFAEIAQSALNIQRRLPELPSQKDPKRLEFLPDHC